MARRSKLERTGRAILLALLFAAVAFPFYCMFVTSIRPKQAAFEFLPREVDRAAYK